MRNDDQTAVIVMDTGSESPSPVAEAIFAILDKRKGYEFKAPLPATGINLEDYAGRYSEQPWGSEAVMLPWAGGLVFLHLPSTDPAADMGFLKPKGGDVFRRVQRTAANRRRSGLRDASGKVTSFIGLQQPDRLGIELLPKTKISVKQ